MAPGGQPCDWTTDPNDKIALVAYFKTIKDKIGQGGSWDQTCLESAAAHMVARGPPAKGAPKNANSIKGIWAGMKKIHDALVLVQQKRYPGASGWTYNQLAGFSVCDANRDEWKEFSKQHPVFKPFATKGWEFFDDVKDILPTRARGMNVFNPAVLAIPSIAPSQDSGGGSQPQLPSDLEFDFPPPSQFFDDESQLITDWSQTQVMRSQSQPFSDWSQTQSGVSQPGSFTQPGALIPAHTPTPPRLPTVPGPASASIPATPSNAATPMAPLGVPSSGVKRAASDEFSTPWTAKKGKTSGADALLAIGGSVDRVGNAIRDCFMPQKSSAVSPTKQVERARQLAVADREAGSLSERERATLNLIFTKDPKAADAYVAEKTVEGRNAVAEILIERF
ncbi:hypothetical protein B0H16DRAFT_1791545 [Mycena metata]|uniref:Myb/SANT-like domain-containing protein n=1 Tax=Mycena metata TaxID=1033252 RepID=A0AAD7MKA9_9AGAR|nr:hypothetical protein B0H16DRAFT_1791545 [Mycena metata]